MDHKKILMLSTYPVAEPLHGGQKRIEAILEFYRGIFAEVKFVAVFHQRFFDKYEASDIPVQDPELIKSMEDTPAASDLISGEAIYDDKEVRQKIINLIEDYRPDVIQVEQIYPYAGLVKLLPILSFKPKIVLGSQNHETSLKRQIFSGQKIQQDKQNGLLKRIEELEKAISQEADLVVAVNDSDAAQHVKYGAKKCIVIPNGISKVVPTEAALKHWQKFKTEHGVSKLVTFVGSAHPPNFLGFEAMIGKDLSFLPSNAGLMLAGGVSNHIQQEYGDERNWAKKFWKRAWPLGNLSNDNLTGLIQESEVIILPIVSGVGSNLKTAEAILADKKIVGTHLAFRTFERYAGLPNIWLSDEKEKFQESIADALKSSIIPRSQEQTKIAQEVQWSYCVRPLGRAMEILVEGHSKALYRRTRRALGRLKRRLFHAADRTNAL